jgi:RHS repeat-associated protein
MPSTLMSQKAAFIIYCVSYPYTFLVDISSYSLLLDAIPNRIIGLAKSMQVLPGDTIDMEAYAKYLPAEGDNTNMAAAIATAITGAFGLTASATGELLNAYNSLNGLFAGGSLPGAGSWETGQEPMAYINYILFDKNFVNYRDGFARITQNGELNYEKLLLTAVPTKPGYLYIYLSNETPKQMEVYFDDLTITHHHTPVIQTDDYYPFGLAIAGLSGRTENKVENRFLYNGKELQSDLELDWYDYGARMYDASLGRFHTIDPKVDKYSSQSPYAYAINNPILFIDKNGEGPSEIALSNFNKANLMNGKEFVWGTANLRNVNHSNPILSTSGNIFTDAAVSSAAEQPVSTKRVKSVKVSTTEDRATFNTETVQVGEKTYEINTVLVEHEITNTKIELHKSGKLKSIKQTTTTYSEKYGFTKNDDGTVEIGSKIYGSWSVTSGKSSKPEYISGNKELKSALGESLKINSSAFDIDHNRVNTDYGSDFFQRGIQSTIQSEQTIRKVEKQGN